MMENYQHLHKFLESKIGAVLLTVTDINNTHSIDEQSMEGCKLLYTNNEHYFSHQTIPEPLKRIMLEVAELALSRRDSKVYRRNISFHKNCEIVELELYAEVYPPPPHLIVAGAGHVAKPVVELGKRVGMNVTVVCDRPQYATQEQFPWADDVKCVEYINYFKDLKVDANTFVLLLTRGHQYDVLILREMLGRNMGYLGMIGSKRRISGVFSQLAVEFPEESFQNIFAPVGLDLGAETPEEIAVSVIAEILKIKNGHSGDSLRDRIKYFIKRKEKVGGNK